MVTAASQTQSGAGPAPRGVATLRKTGAARSFSLADDAIIAAFKRAKVFQHLAMEDLREFASYATSRRFSKGAYIFQDGDRSDVFYLVQQGCVKLYKTSASGKILSFFVAGPGDTLNASAVNLDAYFMSAQTLTDTTVLGVPKPRYVAFLARHGTVAMEIIAVVANRLREEQQRTVDIAGEEVEIRLIKSLLTLASGLGTTLLLTREELATFAGTTTETTIRVLSHFKKQGIIAGYANKGEIVISDLAKLQNTLVNRAKPRAPESVTPGKASETGVIPLARKPMR